jgi:predicted nucleic acid-binding protein
MVSEILSLLCIRRTGTLSAQVLQELFISSTQKGKYPISPETAREIIADLLHWSLVVIDGKNILRAIDLPMEHHLPFWDSLIVQVAIVSKSQFLLSENFQHGQVIESMIVVNPLLALRKKTRGSALDNLLLGLVLII